VAPVKTEESGPTYPIESVDRALTLILAFEETDSISVTETSKLLDVSRSTAYRLLSVLEHRGFARQDPRTKMYHTGSALLRVALAANHRSDIRAALHPLLEQVVAEVDETAHLVLLERNEAFFLDCVEGSKMIRATPRVGTILPAHVVAGGKALLAELPEPALERILSGELAGLTPRSITSAASLRREIAQIRDRGWAINDGESETGLRAVAAHVPAAPDRGGLDTAISVSGPAVRLDDARLQEIAEFLVGRIAQFVDAGF
jgi:DNA-binding IclR family transcriptional regulator